jgi:NADPH:quinone reductase-like Zn-dependent oxidoreductase
MKAVRIHEFGGPQVLRTESVEAPTIKVGEVLVKIAAAGINPVDAKIREGHFSKIGVANLPIILGRDTCGVIEAAGSDAKWPVGTEIYALLEWSLGGYAEYVAIPASLCARKPQRLDSIESAAIPLAGLTAWQGLFDHGQLIAGQSVLIHAGTGGVGHFAVQFAKARGARVFATAATQNLDFLSQLGADVIIDYKKQKFEHVAKDIDVVLDLLGGDTRERSWEVLKGGGILVSTLGEPDQARAAKQGVRAMGYMTRPNPAELDQIRALVDMGEVTPTVTKIFPLSDAAQAHQFLQDQHPRGKIVFSLGL